MSGSIVFPLSLTVLWSIAFASVMHSWPVGICLALCFGMTFGLFSSKDAAGGKKGNHREKEDETDAVCIGSVRGRTAKTSGKRTLRHTGPGAGGIPGQDRSAESALAAGAVFNREKSEEAMRMKYKYSNWMSFAAVLLFAAAVFQIADGTMLPGIVFFGGAAVFAYAAGFGRKREKGEALQKRETEGGRSHAED